MDFPILIVVTGYGEDDVERCDPFYTAPNNSESCKAKECAARRQADAIEEWLYLQSEPKPTNNYWDISAQEVACHQLETNIDNNRHQWRLDRIKWCLEQLGEADE
jgi:hypothetical protein